MQPPSASISDEDLACAVQRGEMSALETLVGRYQSPLLGFLYRAVGSDRPLAEDLVQETFLRMLRSIHQYQYPRPFKRWMYAIALNLARDHYRRAEGKHTYPVVDEEALLESSREEPGFEPQDACLQVEAGQRALAVSRAFTRLPSHQREVILLRYYQELSLHEIGELLSIPVGTVKSRLSLGIQRLQALLAQEDPV